MILGAGAAGLMCAITAGRRGRSVLVLDHAEKIGEKIRISGGGRCNFTNVHATPANFLSENPHFCKSALSRYKPADIMALLTRYGIGFHEKKLGQMFCDGPATQVVDMLLAEAAKAGAGVESGCPVENVRGLPDGGYAVTANGHEVTSASLVIATGGLSIPKIGATGFGHRIAQSFGLPLIPTRPGLVPLTFQGAILDECRTLSGLSVDAEVRCGRAAFREGLLFTHRGLSGPSILQISSYWREGEDIRVNLAPDTDALAFFKDIRASAPKTHADNALARILPQRLAESLAQRHDCLGPLGGLSDAKLSALAAAVNAWTLRPAGTEGYRTAEVTLGGVDTRALSSRTMESTAHPGLFFIGEVVDVTGHLGGFNFQWAWASGHAAGESA